MIKTNIHNNNINSIINWKNNNFNINKYIIIINILFTKISKQALNLYLLTEINKSFFFAILRRLDKFFNLSSLFSISLWNNIFY